MKFFLNLSTILYLIFICFSIWLDESLITTRNNFITFSLIFLFCGYFFREKEKRNLSDITYFILGGIILVFSSYTAIVSFPTNDIINRNFLRSLHYAMLVGYIVFYIKYANRSFLITSAYIILMHSIFFIFNDYLAIYLVPFLLISIALEQIEHKNNTIQWSSWRISIFLFIILSSIYSTNPASIQEYRTYGLLILIIPVLLVVRNIPDFYISKFIYLILIILIFQAFILNINIFRDTFIIYHNLDPRGTILGIPVSTLGSLGCFGFFISSAFIVFPEKKRIHLILGILLFTLSASLLFFSFSRTSFLASIIVFVFLFILANKLNFRRIFRNKIFLSFGFVFFCISLFAFVQKSFELNTVHVRLSIWEFHIKSAIQFAPFFGLGMEPEWRIIYSLPRGLSESAFNHIVEYLNIFRSNPIAHNLFVQTFSSFGLVGITLLFSLLIYLVLPIFRFFNNKNITLFELIYSAVIVGLILHELTDISLLEHQILFPTCVIIALLKPKTNFSKNNFSGKINVILMLAFSILILISTLQINLMKIHKKDLKDIFAADNLLFLVEKDSNRILLNWSHPDTDTLFTILPEKNFYKMKYFYNINQYKVTNDLAYLGSASSELKKCIYLKPEEPLCIFYLANTIEYLKPEGYENITEFLYTIAKIQDPFFTIPIVESNIIKP